MNLTTLTVAMLVGCHAFAALRASPIPQAPPGPRTHANSSLSRFTFAETHMGSKVQLTLYAPDETSAKRAATAAFARVAEIDGIMSDYRPTSELLRLCQKAGGGPVPVSDDLFLVLSRALEVSRRSGGAFDVTVGPVVKLWRRARKSFQMPDPDDLAKARALVGWQMIKLDPKARTAELTKPGMLLDLGGIAKGYAADAALKVLKQHGIDRALVALSGDIAAGGPPPGEEGWKVGLSPLEGTRTPPIQFVLLKDAAVSTSGDAEQYVEIDGKRYSHIVDPKTGLGLVGRIGVTVIARDGTTADSLATAACVLGPERGRKLIEETPGAEVLFVRKTAKGEELVASKGFPKGLRDATQSGTGPAAGLKLSWEKNILTIAGPNVPGGDVKVWYLEAYCRPGSTDRDWKETVIGHKTELLAAGKDGRTLKLRCTLNDGVVVEHVITAADDEVDFRLTAHNPTKQASQAHWAQPCVRVDRFTGRGKTDYLPKCFIFRDGKPVRMPFEPWATKARYVPGQVWCPKHVDRNDVNPRPLSEIVPSNGLIGCYSADDRWILATAWEPYQELFQGIIACLHSDFRIGGLKPGETKQIRGKLYLVPARMDDLLKRYRKDFPEHTQDKPGAGTGR